MIKLETKTMQKAIAKSKQMRPRVRMIGERIYSVSGSRGNSYTVTFSVANGLKLGACTCPAGEAGQMCYHIAAAAAVNIAIQSMRRAAAQVAAPVPPAETDADDRAQLITDIKAAWHRARPFASLDGAVRQVFGPAAKLETLAADDLRRILAALTPGRAVEQPAATSPRRAPITYRQTLHACARRPRAVCA